MLATITPTNTDSERSWRAEGWLSRLDPPKPPQAACGSRARAKCGDGSGDCSLARANRLAREVPIDRETALGAARDGLKSTAGPSRASLAGGRLGDRFARYIAAAGRRL